jgi:hypothetical protein
VLVSRILAAAAVACTLAIGAPAAAQQQAQPPASPRDSVRVALPGGASVSVDYGRPSARGRAIMGGLVPWRRVWRTGANAATTLVVSADVRIGDTLIPRGTYTLFTIPEQGRWTLIVNRQTGQWGTQYDPARDLARIPMRVSALRSPVETFTVKLEPGAGGATLALEWERTRAFVPVRPAREAARGHGSH